MPGSELKFINIWAMWADWPPWASIDPVSAYICFYNYSMEVLGLFLDKLPLVFRKLPFPIDPTAKFSNPILEGVILFFLAANGAAAAAARVNGFFCFLIGVFFSIVAN